MKAPLVIVILVCLVALGVLVFLNSRPSVSTNVVGVYLESGIASPEAQLRLELRDDGRWVMGNAITMFRGTWKKSEQGCTLTYLNGPGGELSKPDIVPAHFANSSTLIVGDDKGSITFTKQSPEERFVLPLESKQP